MNVVKLLAVMVGFCWLVSPAGEARPFEDKFGRVIEAELVSHSDAKGDVVKIDKGGTIIDAKIALFSDKDQQFIRDWMARTPATIDYAFRVEAHRKVTDTTRSKGYSEKEKSADNFYEIRVTNLTRQTVSGIRVDYKAFMHNNGDPDGRSNFGSRFGSRSSRIVSVSDSLELPGELAYNRSARITTKKLRIDSSRATSTYTGSTYSDELLGIIIRVYDPQGAVVTEWRTPNRKFEKIPWTYGERPTRPSTAGAGGPAPTATPPVRPRVVVE